jgi:hypothetical protein
MGTSFFWGVVAQITLAVGMYPSIFKLFAFVEDRTSPQAKKDIAAWLKRIDVSGIARTISDNVVYAFRTLYGARHFSLRCLWRVGLLATVALVISLSVVGGWKPLFTTEEKECIAWGPWRDAVSPNGEFRISPPPCRTWDVTGDAAKRLAEFFLLVNVPIDYVAIGVTRLLLSRLSTSRLSFKRGFLLLVFDLVTKSVLAVLGLFFIPNVELLFKPCPPESLCLGPGFGALVGLLTGKGLEGPIARASFLAMLLGSLWIWMYYFSLLAFGSIGRTHRFVAWLRWFLDIDGQPIRSIGAVTAAISTLVYAFVLLAFQLIGR